MKGFIRIHQKVQRSSAIEYHSIDVLLLTHKTGMFDSQDRDVWREAVEIVETNNFSEIIEKVFNVLFNIKFCCIYILLLPMQSQF